MLPGARKIVSCILFTGLVAGSLLLAGCTLEKPTNVTPEKIRLSREPYSNKVPTAWLDAEALNALGEHYRHYGYGPVDVTVTYDPASRVNTAMQAANQVSRIASGLAARQVPVEEADILPVQAQGDVSVTLVNYQQVKAHKPEGCFAMGGAEGRPAGLLDKDYRMGCTVEMQIARQIANPKDLAGREGLGIADGRPQANIVEGYKTGAERPPLEGISIGE